MAGPTSSPPRSSKGSSSKHAPLSGFLLHPRQQHLRGERRARLAFQTQAPLRLPLQAARRANEATRAARLMGKPRAWPSQGLSS